MIKIKFIHHSTGLGGAPVSLYWLIKSLPSSEYDVEVILLRNSTLVEYFNSKGIKCSVIKSFFYNKIYYPYIHIEVSWLRLKSPVRLIYFAFTWILSRLFFSKLFSKIESDIIHLNSYTINDLLCNSSKNSKVIIHIREPAATGYFGIRSAIFKSQIKKYANHIVAISKDNAIRIGIPEKTSVIYNQYNPKSYSYEWLGFGNYVIFLGGGIPFKGLETLLNSLDYLDSNINVLVFGEVKQSVLDFLQIKLKKSDVYENCSILISCKGKNIKSDSTVFFMGMREDVGAYIKNAKILLNLFEITHFPRPVIEAFSYAVPVVVTKVDGICEVVNDGVNGIIINVSDYLSLAASINFLISNEKIRFMMGQEGLKSYLNNFGQNISLGYDTLYKTITTVR